MHGVRDVVRYHCYDLMLVALVLLTGIYITNLVHTEKSSLNLRSPMIMVS